MLLEIRSVKDITRYTYLNLRTRSDRKLLATCTAFRNGIPEDLIHFREQDIYLGDCVLDGIKGACDFAIVFSTKGAEMLLEQMLKTPPWRGVEVILSDKNWCPDGIFTTAFPFVKRYPLRLVKSDNFAEDPNFIETPEMRL